MTDAGKLIGVPGISLVGTCLVGAGYWFVREFLARSALPVEMQTPEMIQYHFDGEVVLLSLTFGSAFLCGAFVFTMLFGFLFIVCDLAKQEGKP